MDPMCSMGPMHPSIGFMTSNAFDDPLNSMDDSNPMGPMRYLMSPMDPLDPMDPKPYAVNPKYLQTPKAQSPKYHQNQAKTCTK